MTKGASKNRMMERPDHITFSIPVLGQRECKIEFPKRLSQVIGAYPQERTTSK